MRQGRSSSRWRVLLCLVAIGCAEAVSPTPAKPPAAGSFESDVPANLSGSASRSGGKAEGGFDASANGPSTAPPGAATPQVAPATPGTAVSDSSARQAERAIAEADIIQIQGERLFALSRMSGLAIIDVHDPSQLKLLGRYRELPAEPFELYIRENVALVMFTGWGDYKRADDGSYSWVSTSKLLALDVSDAANVSRIGSFDVPGSISDSRMVGDVLYIASHQDGYCWGCQQSKPRTAVSSLNVRDVKDVQKIDELFFEDPQNSYSGQRSIVVTTERMYVSGPEYSANGQATGSKVRVVDISNPNGDLVEGATIEVAGQVNSRWQMDEYQNVLRVISQPQQVWTQQGLVTVDPTLETFKVESSQKLTALGKLALKIPVRETLRSARFDGPRAYAITALQMDPLFTIDLTDPAKPQQVGELEMPGFVWHLEPRGDRVLGVGFDQNNPLGGLTVSLFDVTNLTTPKMLSRVNFGGNWGQLPSDQDRAHKVFRVLEDAGLVLVPFSGWENIEIDGGKGYCGGRSAGGVQIIDYKNDTLTKRGAAPATGEARRALLHHDKLLTVSDERVQSFDIGNRDNPALVSEVVMARQVYQAVQLANDVVARFSYNSRNGQQQVDFVKGADAGDPEKSLSELSIASLAGGVSTSQCEKSVSVQQVLVHGSEMDLLYETWGVSARGEGTQTRGVLVIDASDPTKPAIKSDTHWNNDQGWSTYHGFFNYGYYQANASVLRTDNTITMLESRWKEQVSQVSFVSTLETRLRVLDMRDPSNVTMKLLPFQAAASYSGLISDGDTVLTSHMVDGGKGRARFYVDRFDVSDPSNPQQLPSVNVPGALLHYDAASGRAITTEQKRTLVNGLTYPECANRFSYFEWNDPSANVKGGVSRGGTATPPSAASAPMIAGDSAAPVKPIEPVYPKGDCTGFTQSLHLVQLLQDGAALEDTITLDESQQLTASSMGDGVVFGSIGQGGYYGGPRGGVLIDCFGPCGGPVFDPKPSELLVLGGFGSGKFEVGQISVENNDANSWYGFWGTPPVYASGKKALLVGQKDVAIIDATTASKPVISRRVDLIAPPQSVDVRNGRALLVLGAQGVQWLSLD